MLRKIVFFITLLFLPLVGWAQFNTDRLVTIGRSALYYEDYVLSIQYFNRAIAAKPCATERWQPIRKVSFMGRIRKFRRNGDAGEGGGAERGGRRGPGRRLCGG